MAAAILSEEERRNDSPAARDDSPGVSALQKLNVRDISPLERDNVVIKVRWCAVL